jgi:hypothetical protein
MFLVFSIITGYMAFRKSLIKEYGEQVYRDSKYSNRSLSDCSYSSAMVAQACGECKDEEKFRLAILKYANETKFPENFV